MTDGIFSLGSPGRGCTWVSEGYAPHGKSAVLGVGAGRGWRAFPATSATSCHSAPGTLPLCALDTLSKLCPCAWSDLPPGFHVTSSPWSQLSPWDHGPGEGEVEQCKGAAVFKSLFLKLVFCSSGVYFALHVDFLKQYYIKILFDC